MYLIEEQAFLHEINERIKGVDQDTIRQEMQEQAKHRATEPVAAEGLEPAAKSHVVLF